MPELDDLFTAGTNKTTGVEATTDAQATLEDVLPSEESGLEQTQVEETPNTEVQPEVTQEVAGESTQDEVDYKALYESMKLDKERIEKQHRDNQSYNDRRFNELQQEFNKFKEVKEQPKEKEYTQEELSDLQYSNPEEWFKVMAGKLGYTEPQKQAAPQNNQLAIDEGVQRAMHDDYDDVINNLLKVQAYHPEVIAKIQAAPNRAKAAYEEGKKLQEANTNPVDAEALEKQIREKILKEMEEGKVNNNRTGLRKVPSSAPVKASGTTKSKDALSGLFKAGKGGRR